MDLRHREHAGVAWRHVARHDRLQAPHEGRGDHERVARLVRHGGMAALPLHRDVEERRAGHGRALADAERAGPAIGRIVHPVDLVAGEPLEEPVGEHALRAAEPLLRGLEDQHRRPREVPRRRQMLRRAQQHRRVPVVTAGVHDPGRPGGVVEVRALLDRQRVHVRAQPDPARPLTPAVDQPDDARPRDAVVHLVHSVLPQLVGDDPGRPVLLEPQFGMGVQVAEDRGQLRGAVGDGGRDVHGMSFVGSGPDVPWWQTARLVPRVGRSAAVERRKDRLYPGRPGALAGPDHGPAQTAGPTAGRRRADLLAPGSGGPGGPGPPRGSSAAKTQGPSGGSAIPLSHGAGSRPDQVAVGQGASRAALADGHAATSDVGQAARPHADLPGLVRAGLRSGRPDRGLRRTGFRRLPCRSCRADPRSPRRRIRHRAGGAGSRAPFLRSSGHAHRGRTPSAPTTMPGRSGSRARARPGGSVTREWTCALPASYRDATPVGELR